MQKFLVICLYFVLILPRITPILNIEQQQTSKAMKTNSLELAYVSRKALMQAGLSQYQVTALTKSIPFETGSRRVRYYLKSLVLQAIQLKLANKRTRKTTQQALKTGLDALSNQLVELLDGNYTVTSLKEALADENLAKMVTVIEQAVLAEKATERFQKTYGDFKHRQHMRQVLQVVE